MTVTSSPARRAGYVAAVVVNSVLLVVINVRPGWGVLPFLTDDVTEVLWLINLSLAASTAVNLTYLWFDRSWFKSLCQIGTAFISLVAAVRLYQVFPFDFSAYAFNWAAVTRVILALAIFGSVVAIAVEVVKLTGVWKHQGPRAPSHPHP